MKEKLENLEGIDKKWLERAVIALICVTIGFIAGWQISSQGSKDEILELQWQIENLHSEKQELETAESQQIMIVHVTGCVENPGIVQLMMGSRVYEAIEKAGPLPEADVDALPMARNLVDGETIFVPDKNGTLVNPAVSAAGNTAGNKININTAGTQELMNSLPGIGEKLAMRIITYRENHGPFASEKDICKVSGIGEGKYSQIADLITVK